MQSIAKRILSLVVCLGFIASSACTVYGAAASGQDSPESFPEISSSVNQQPDDTNDDPVQPPDITSVEETNNTPVSSQEQLAISEAQTASVAFVKSENSQPTAMIESELLALAEVDGAKAAEVINQYTDDQIFHGALEAILNLYYSKNLTDQLSAFSSMVDNRASSLLANYRTAADDREQAYEKGYLPGQVLVRLHSHNLSNTKSVLSEHKSELVQTIQYSDEQSIAVVEIPLSQTVQQAVEEFQSNPNVVSVQPNYLYHRIDPLAPTDQQDSTPPLDELSANRPASENQPKAIKPNGGKITTNDEYLNYLWHFQNINLAPAWNLVSQIPKSLRSPTSVAIVDCFLDVKHEDLKTNHTTKYSCDFVNGYKQPFPVPPRDDHGTHVSGIIGASTNNGPGVAGVGTGYDNRASRFFFVNVFEILPDGKAGASTSSIVAAISYINDLTPARVINMSLGGSGNDPLFEDILKKSSNKNVTVVCAAGNDYTSEPMYPSDYASTISVMATDEHNAPASFSNFGPNKDLCAPGVNIVSSVPTNSYAYMSGTSMASPVVTGVVALMLYVNPSLHPEEVRMILNSNTTNIDDTTNDPQRVRNGLVNAGKAVAAAYNQIRVKRVNITESIGSLLIGQTKHLSAEVFPVYAVNKDLHWKSSNTSVATVSEHGSITAKKTGSTTITATAENGVKDSFQLSVCANVTSVKAAQKTVRLTKGKSLNLTAIPYISGTGKSNLSWSSSASSIVAVNKNGKITARKQGKAVITAKSENGKKATTTVYVVPKEVELNGLVVKGTKSIKVGSKRSLSVALKPNNATGIKLKFSSSNPKVAKIDAAGTITALKKGKTVITVTAANKKATYKISVV